MRKNNWTTQGWEPMYVCSRCYLQLTTNPKPICPNCGNPISSPTEQGIIYRKWKRQFPWYQFKKPLYYYEGKVSFDTKVLRRNGFNTTKPEEL